MEHRSYSFEEFGFGSKLIRDLINENPDVAQFTDKWYDPEKINTLIQKRLSLPVDRKKLTAVLFRQNSGLNLSENSKSNIAKLELENTFTVTTGHQLNLFTGPLFSIYKIIQCLVIAEKLNQKYPSFNFVPVFWMASEDHDFEEINHIHLFGKKIVWEKNDQQNVIAGRLKTVSMHSCLDEIHNLFQDDKLKSEFQKLKDFYLGSDNLATATRKLINHLFADSGLVILDGNDPELKQEMRSAFKQEILNQTTFKEVSVTNVNLESKKYPVQVHVRNCNLFYIHADGKRERIILENEKFQIDGKSFSAGDLSELIEKNPENFSPNALLRPVYQETVLPNLIYVGGGGEISYWLQLKSLFDKLGVCYPMLRVRDSVFNLTEKQNAELETHNLKIYDLQKNIAHLMNEIVLQKSGDSFSIEQELKNLEELNNRINSKVQKADPTMSSMVNAEFAKFRSGIEKVESKMMKALRQKEENTSNRLLKIQEKLFPENHFQERHDNFLSWYFSDSNRIFDLMSVIFSDKKPSIHILIN
ncbi:MAG: bacillithiol biosynthesis cysteine-adding enzyme BshC [Crocinitomicaceae bacterium]|nr:bacillithiol biosynthesis cysteine-adding enzyme BshC [Crocinitomicaceae bacterium]